MEFAELSLLLISKKDSGRMANCMDLQELSTVIMVPGTITSGNGKTIGSTAKESWCSEMGLSKRASGIVTSSLADDSG